MSGARSRPGETLRFGALEVRPLLTPGHTAGMLSFLVGEPAGQARAGTSMAPGGFTGREGVVFTGDTLFRGSVGGVRAPGHTTYTDLKDSIMGTLMELPADTVIEPGHAERTTVAEEWNGNPFIRVWRGLAAEGTEQCTALGEPATLILLCGDYDGGHKAWVRWPDGADDIVPGSQIKHAVVSARAQRPKLGYVAREKIPTSRVRRTATVGRLAAGEAVKQFGTRAANVTRSEEAGQEALARRQVETAKQIVAVLGTMKGAAMKLGQVMSFLDVGLVPEEYREEFQQELAKLRDAAPKVSFKQMRKVIEDDLEEPVGEIFETFDEEPIAAASIGQVYRATLREGPAALATGSRAVAVKVQYPGVAAAVRADMQNLDMIMRLLKRMTPQLDVKAIANEIRDRIGEELDYELEAQNQRSLARIFEGHPFIVVPEVVSSLSRERVLVSELVHGVGFEELKGYSQEQRDRIGEIVFRFFLGCLYRHRQFSGDPHPGQLHAARRRARRVPGLRAVQAPGRRAGRARAGGAARGQRAGRGRTAQAAGRVRLPARPRARRPRRAAGVHRRRDLVVHERRSRGADAGDRDAGDDRELRSALAPLPRDAPPGHARRAPLRAAHGDAHAGGALAAARA